MPPPTNVPLPPEAPKDCSVINGCCANGEQKPTILTIDGPLKGASGGYKWTVAFQLPKRSCGGGYLIQEIQRTETQGSRAVSTEHFWEAWQVYAKESISYRGSNARKLNRDRPDDDTYSANSISDPGVVEIKGYVKFYELAKIPPEFDDGTGVPSAGFGRSTQTRPKIWSPTGGTVHNLRRVWDSKAGTNELEGDVDGVKSPGTP